MIKKIIVFISLMFLIFPIMAFSQSIFDNMGMGMFFGNEVVDGNTYQTFSLQPKLTFGKLSLGLDLFFEFDENFNLRKDSNGKVVGWSTWQDYVNKVLFVQWGEKGEPLFVKYGLFDNVTLGHGLIMQNYSNSLLFPEVRKSGLELDLDGTFFNFPFVGFESFIDDLKNPSILAARVYVRPLLMLDIPIIKLLRVGFSYATDLDPDATEPYVKNPASNETVSIYGIDMDVPVLTSDLATVLVYTDWAAISGKGSGMKFGVSSVLIKIIGLGAEIYNYGDKFTGPYFDQIYDNFSVRNTKYSDLDLYQGYLGWKAFAYLTIGQQIFTTYAEISGDFDSTNTVKPTLIASIVLNEGLIPVLSGSFTFIRSDISKFSDIYSWTDTNALLNSYMQFKITLKPGTMTTVSLIYERKYELQGSNVVPVSTSYFITGIEF